MSTELIINASLPETRIALMEDGEIQELLIERASGKGIVGNIYKGRVTRVLPGMQAAFVDIGLEKAAFLYVDDVYVHSHIWEREEGGGSAPDSEVAEGESESTTGEGPRAAVSTETTPEAGTAAEAGPAPQGENLPSGGALPESFSGAFDDEASLGDEEEEEDDLDLSPDEEEEEDEDDHGPEAMGPGEGEGGDDRSSGRGEQPSGTMAPPPSQPSLSDGPATPGSSAAEGSEGAPAEGGANAGSTHGESGDPSDRNRRRRRGRRGGRNRRRGREGDQQKGQGPSQPAGSENAPAQFQDQMHDAGSVDSDRSELSVQAEGVASAGEAGRPDSETGERSAKPGATGLDRGEFKQKPGSDRRIRAKQAPRPVRAQVNIQDLLKEGQEVIVQIAKDPIATKGARLTCHISLPGRHLVCMPTIDHVGVSRRIERDDERRKMRDFVERNRPKGLGFIVRTATGRGNYEKRIKQDIDYLTRLWNEIRDKAAEVSAPALVYEDLNSVLRAIRDWVTEDIDKIVVDSRFHFNEIQRFCSHFMPSLKQKVELYNSDTPIFDAYNISPAIARSLERKVWLKSGGYIVIDQAEALVAIDVNTGRYVGKKNLEDTILKTNLEAVQEIAYQLRLRNCGGIIVLDLIDMEKEENKQRVYRALEEALKKDRARPSIQKISDLGLVEMTRKRTRDTMVRALCEPCSQCEGKGFIKSKQTVAYDILREIEREGMERDIQKILVQAHPDVIDILAIDEKETLDALERRYRKQVLLQAVMDAHPEQFEVFGDKKGKAQISSHKESRAQQRGERNDRNERGGRRERGRDRDRDRERDRNRDRDRDRNRQQQSRDAQNPVPVQAPEGNFNEESAGNRVQQAQAPSERAPQQGAGAEDFSTEEDRLAFLRAQAAQDAALARLRGGSEAPSVGSGRAAGQGGDRGGQGGERGERGGRRGRRGRRGRGGGRDRHAGGQSSGPRPAAPGASGGASPITPVSSSAPGESRGESEGGGSGGGPTGESSGTPGHIPPV